MLQVQKRIEKDELTKAENARGNKTRALDQNSVILSLLFIL